MASETGRIPSLDGIRGVAILLVLLWHGFFASLANLPNHASLQHVIEFGRLTWSGVDLFFVLSGFLIGGILLDELESEKYFAAFYIRRAHRILPLYAAVVMVVILARFLRGGAWVTNHIPYPYYACFLQNFWMVHNDTFGSNVLGVTWSLAVEEQFYLTLPVTIRYLSRSQLWWVVGSMIAGAPMLRILLIHTLPHGLFAGYVLMPCRADALGYGVAAALISRTPNLWGAFLRNKILLYVALGGTFLGVVALVSSDFTLFTATFFGLEYSLLALFYFLLLLSTLTGRKFKAVFSAPILRYLGTIAYGLYLFHPAFLYGIRAVAMQIYPGQSGWITLECSICGIILAVAMAALSWKYLEKPLIKRGHRYDYGRNLPEMAPPTVA